MEDGPRVGWESDIKKMKLKQSRDECAPVTGEAVGVVGRKSGELKHQDERYPFVFSTQEIRI